MKKIFIVCMAIAVLASCSKKSTPTPVQTIKLETYLDVTGKSYTVSITETVSGSSKMVLDTTVTGKFDYNYTAATNVKNDIEVDSDDSLGVLPTIQIVDNGTSETNYTKTDTNGQLHIVFLF